MEQEINKRLKIKLQDFSLGFKKVSGLSTFTEMKVWFQSQSLKGKVLEQS